MMIRMIAVGLMLCLSSNLSAQEVRDDSNPRPRTNVISGTQNFSVAGGGAIARFSTNSLDSKIRQASKAIQSAESELEREKAQAELRKLLSEDYDARIADYASYLDNLEEQLAAMRKKLDRRRQAKNDMIDLRIQVLNAEANDLGWPTQINTRGAFPRAFTSPRSSRSGTVGTRFPMGGGVTTTEKDE